MLGWISGHFQAIQQAEADLYESWTEGLALRIKVTYGHSGAIL